jgi:hypothetical protein
LATINDNNEEIKTDNNQLDLTSFIPRLASRMEEQKANKDAIEELMIDVIAPASSKNALAQFVRYVKRLVIKPKIVKGWKLKHW